MIGQTGKCVIAGRRCPKNGDATKGTFCPCWVTVSEVHAESGETRIREACSHVVMLDWMRDAVRGTWSGAAEVSAMRREVNDKVDRLNGDPDRRLIGQVHEG